MIKALFSRKLKGQAGQLQLDINLELEKGKFYGLMGESGAGKTSILKIIAGLMKPDSGSISYDDRLWFDHTKSVHVKPQLRKVGFVFQDYALFPNMTVEQNLTYALNGASGKDLLNEILEIMDLKSLVKSRPQQLSGGQQQRVALARAILRGPEIVLLDEPLSALDRKLRNKLQNDLEELHRHYGFTTLMVTHDESEVTRLADEVFILDEGKIAQNGPPLEVLNPALALEIVEGKIIGIDTKGEQIVISQSKGIFKIRMSSGKLEKLSIGQHLKLKSKDWSIHE